MCQLKKKYVIRIKEKSFHKIQTIHRRKQRHNNNKMATPSVSNGRSRLNCPFVHNRDRYMMNGDHGTENIQSSGLEVYKRISPDFYMSIEDSIKFAIKDPEKVDIILRASNKKVQVLNKLREQIPEAVTDENIIALHSYTFDLGEDDKEHNLHRIVNKVLSERNSNSIYSLRGYILHLFSALRNLKVAEDIQTLYRVIDGGNGFDFDGYKPGCIRSWPGFTSTFKFKECTDDFADEWGKDSNLIVFEILNPKVCYNIKLFSEHEDEEGFKK